MECETCEGRCSQILSKLGRGKLENLRKMMKSIRYRKGETIFQEGAPAFGLYIVCEGVVKLVKYSLDGKEQILKLIGPGEILGEKTMFDRSEYTAFAEALTDTSTKFIDRSTFMAFLKKHPQVSLKIIEKLSLELKRFQAKLLETSYTSSSSRLARVLLELGRKFGCTNGNGKILLVNTELRRSDFAGMVGISTETAIRTLSKFQRRNLISVNGRKIEILDVEALEDLTEPSPIELEENLI